MIEPDSPDRGIGLDFKMLLLLLTSFLTLVDRFFLDGAAVKVYHIDLNLHFLIFSCNQS